ncbi:MAG: hypothetical protein ACKVIG_14575 [Flavobacteriales bacterium]
MNSYKTAFSYIFVVQIKKTTIMGAIDKNKNEDKKDELYKDIETDGVTKNVAGEQTIQTEETKILKSDDKSDGREVLIGKKLEEVEKVEEDHESLQRRILNKLMK